MFIRFKGGFSWTGIKKPTNTNLSLELGIPEAKHHEEFAYNCRFPSEPPFACAESGEMR